jgi:hypothetical protein
MWRRTNETWVAFPSFPRHVAYQVGKPRLKSTEHHTRGIWSPMSQPRYIQVLSVLGNQSWTNLKRHAEARYINDYSSAIIFLDLLFWLPMAIGGEGIRQLHTDN